jgi:acetyl esterase/lipase
MKSLLNPQMPLPSEAAQAYEERVLSWAQDAGAGLRVAKDLPYGPDPLQRFDVYAAHDVAPDAPVLVFFHGGGWTNGYKEYSAFMARHVVSMGCVLVTPGYRLAPVAPLPAAFDDGVTLLARLTELLPTWAGPARRLVLAGHSAGGHLAALLALRAEDLAHAGVAVETLVGCMPISGIFDLHHPEPVPASLEARVYEMVLGPDTDDAQMSPLCWPRGNRIPMVLSWGGHDSLRVRLSNRRLASMLALQPGQIAQFVDPDADHFQTHTDLAAADHPWYRRLASLAHTGITPRE